MSTIRLRAGIFFICIFLVLTACSNSNKSVEEEPKEAEISDEAFISVVETNVLMLMEEDLEGYMETIHSDSPVYESTEEMITELFNYSLTIELSDVEVIEKSEEEVVVNYIQRTVDEEDSDFENNETLGEHTLRLDGGDWKIYQSEVLAVELLPTEEKDIEDVEMDGQYGEQIASLAMPFLESDFKLASYEEKEGEARAEFIPVDETIGDYDELIAYDFYENGNELSNLANFIRVMELSLEEMVTGDLEFVRLLETESEVIYKFSVHEDEKEPNQEEIGRIFISGDDLFIVRYTSVEDEIENEEEIIELLGDIG